MDNLAAHLGFLVGLGCSAARHRQRSLLEHLFGTYKLLEEWGAPEHVRLAGLYHSVYGTQFFKHQSTSNRDTVRTMIGERAEKLVHTFCTEDRRKFTDPELLLIERANLLDQNV